MTGSLYAQPRSITGLQECAFYHQMVLPGFGTVPGLWDLRGREADYLGRVALNGKTVLEMGTASGGLAFYMERQGADVTAYDLSDEQEWDIVPYFGYDLLEHIAGRKEEIRKINNSFWLAHRLFHSRVKMVYGTAYALPDELGEFDICTFGAILLHLRDPFLALQRAAAHTREAIIVTELYDAAAEATYRGAPEARWIRFLPEAARCEPYETWWHFSPGLIVEFLKILGFIETELSFHDQLCEDRETKLYTVVGRKRNS
jgi:Methyltransferase domain